MGADSPIGDVGSASNVRGINIRCDKSTKMMIHQQGRIRHILEKFCGFYLARKEKSTQNQTTSFANSNGAFHLESAASPTTPEVIKVMEDFPLSMLIGHLQYLNKCTHPQLTL